MKGLLWSGAVFGDLERGAGLRCVLRNIGEKTRDEVGIWKLEIMQYIGNFIGD